MSNFILGREKAVWTILEREKTVFKLKTKEYSQIKVDCLIKNQSAYIARITFTFQKQQSGKIRI